MAAVLLCTGSQAKAGLITFEISNIVLSPGAGIDTPDFEFPGAYTTPGPVPNPSGYENGTNGGKDLSVYDTAPRIKSRHRRREPWGATGTGAIAHLGFTAAELFITPGEAGAAESRNFTLAFDIKAFGDAAATHVILTLLGTATTGRVNDAAVDYFLQGAARNGVSYRGTGIYDITVHSLSLANSSAVPLDLTVSIVNPVPEPTSIALLLCGGVATVIAGYRRRVVA